MSTRSNVMKNDKLGLKPYETEKVVKNKYSQGCKEEDNNIDDLMQMIEVINLEFIFILKLIFSLIDGEEKEKQEIVVKTL